MDSKYFNRNTYIAAFGCLVFVVAVCFKFSPAWLTNFSTIMSDTISFASFITCLLFIGLAYLPLQHNSQFMHAMQDLQTNILVMHQILITITFFFTLSVTSLLSLVFNFKSTFWLSTLLTSLWLALLLAGILEVSTLLYELFRIMIYISEERDKNENNY